MGTRAAAIEIGLELTRPWWLLAWLALPVLFYFFCRSLVDFARWQRICSLWLRGLIVVLLVLALAGLEPGPADPRAVRRLRRRPQRERRREGNQAVDAFLSQAFAPAGGNRFAVLPFASEPGNARARRRWRGRRSRSAQSAGAAKDAPAGRGRAVPADAGGLDRKGTDLAAALEVAAAAVPPFYVPRIVLCSDGNATTGDALKAAAALRGKVEVLTVPLPGRTEPEVQLSAVSRPGPGPAGRAVQRRGRDRHQPRRRQGPGRGLSRRHQGRRPGRSSSRKAKTGSSSSRRSTRAG